MEQYKINTNDIREQVYSSYKVLLETGIQPSIDFPSYLDLGNFVYNSFEIDDKSFKGKTYLGGIVISREEIGMGYQGIVIESKPNGIETFEEYTGRGIRPLLASSKSKMVVINKTSLIENPEELDGHSLEEVIGINFSLFPVIMNKRANSSLQEALLHSINLWAKHPLLF